MDNIELYSNQVDEAIEIMREVAAWGRNKGFRVWRDEWLTKEELITSDVHPENFYVGKIGINTVCAFILQWSDSEYWNNAQKNEAVYLHKFCVRREFAGRNMTKLVIEAIKELSDSLPAGKSIGSSSIPFVCEKYDGNLDYKIEKVVCSACAVLNL